MSLFSPSFLAGFAEVLAVSLLHFIWQGIVLTLLLLSAVKLSNVGSARHRYFLSVGTLLMMAGVPIITAIWHQSSHPQQQAVPASVTSISGVMIDEGAGLETNPDVADSAVLVSAIPPSNFGFELYVLFAWLSGVSILSLRLAIGFAIGLWIRAKVQPLPTAFDQCVGRLGEMLAVNVERRVFQCARVGQAVAIGFLRPVVLIPAVWLTQLSPQTIEAIIAHELAHIRRWDLWVNLVQRIIETLLFYHPAVWWLSERIRLEREMCCDELAADCFDRALYARSLVSVAQFADHNLLLATSIRGGRKMRLLNRIGYLLRVVPADTAGTAGTGWTLGIAALILPATALVAFSFTAIAKPPGKASAGSETVDAIVTTTVQPTTVTLFEQYVAKINAQRHIQIRTLANGYVDQLHVKEGQSVKTGDLIFRIQPVIYQAKLDAESAEARIAQLEYNYSKKLHDNKVVSADEVALHEAKLSKAMAKVKLATAELDFTMVKAPFDGVVDRLQRQVGSAVMEGDVVTTLSDNSIVRAYFEVPETRYLAYVTDSQPKEDLAVQLTLASGAAFDEPGRIRSIESNFNSETGTIEFRADFPNPNRILRHGQSGTVKISRQLKNAIVVPHKATFEALDRRYVFCIDKDNIARLREITVQQELNDGLIVKAGLSGGDRIVTGGLRQIVDGGKVAIDDGNQ